MLGVASVTPTPSTHGYNFHAHRHNILDRNTGVSARFVCLGVHAYYGGVAVICDDCLINYISSMIVCFCFSRFFCFFLWAFGVTNFPPIKVARQPTPDPKSQQEIHIFGNSAKQNGIIS